MINLSIDAADMEGRFDSSVNEIESVIELILEVVMDQGDVLPEHDEPDPETETCLLAFDYVVPFNGIQLDVPFRPNACTVIGYISLNYVDPFLVFQSPPPKPLRHTA